jgi:putative SOS response-associated peptidase YedK
MLSGIWTPWKSVRKVKEGETRNNLFAFLTTEPNALVRQYHPKAMPVILTTQDEIDTWMEAPTPVALELQRPLRMMRWWWWRGGPSRVCDRRSLAWCRVPGPQ